MAVYDRRCARDRSRSLRTVRILSLTALLAASCSQNDPVVDPIDMPEPYIPELIQTTALPYSQSGEVALLSDERTACVVDYYDNQVRCVDVEGTVVGVFGREGAGRPGLLKFIRLARGEEGTVGVVDGDYHRFTLFEPSGAVVSEVWLAGTALSTFSLSGNLLRGVGWYNSTTFGSPDTLMTRIEVDIASGEVVREQGSPPGPWDIECGEVYHGVLDRDDGWVFVACEGHLIFVDDTGGATVIRAPTFVPVLPEEWEVPHSLWLDSEWVEEFLTTPRSYSQSRIAMLFDAANRFWIATWRHQSEWSYIDVYENAQYVGSVKVREQLTNFDLVGSTLVVLVERHFGGKHGRWENALNWYDIGEAPFGG